MVLGWFRKKDDLKKRAERESNRQPQPARRYAVGDIIGGNYNVRRVMEGGLGFVYLVDDREGRRLVLKCPKSGPGLSDPEAFRQEAETWVRLGNHPNVVPAYWVDEIAGQLFVAAQFVEADDLGRTTLRDYLRHGPLNPKVVAAWTSDFCHGLIHALSKGLVAHRDIKPENLLIGTTGILRLTDFGIASANMRLFSEKADTNSGRDRRPAGEVQVSGTPPYMAPEQWAGRTQDVRTDIYAFGVVLYEVCHGRLPFMASNIRALAQLHVVAQPHIADGPFFKIIEKCLSKDPAARYSGPVDLLKHVVALSKASGFTLPPRPSAIQPRASDLQALAHGLGALGKIQEALAAAHEFVNLAPDDAGGWTQLARLYLDSDNTKEAFAAIQRSLALDPTRSPAWNNLGVLLNRQQQWQEAIEAFNTALDLDPFNSGALLNSAQSFLRQQRPYDAFSRLKRAAECAPDKFSIWQNLGVLFVEVGDKHQALTCLQRAKAVAPQGNLKQIDDAIGLAQKMPEQASGAAAMLAGDHTNAKKILIQETKLNPRDKVAWHNLGLLYIDEKEHAQAKQCFAKVVELDPTDGFSVCRLIELSALLRDLAAADYWCSKLSQMPGGQAPAIAFKARSLVQCGQYQNAKKLIMEAVQSYPDNLDILIACGDIMMVYPGVGMAMANAVNVYQRAVDILQSEARDVSRLRDIEGRLRLARDYGDYGLR